MTRERKEKLEVLSNLNTIKQLRKLTKEERVIEKHLKANVSVLSMCEKFWQIGIDRRNAATAN